TGLRLIEHRIVSCHIRLWVAVSSGSPMARLSGHGAEPRQLTSPPLAHATLTRHSHTPFRGLPYAVTNRLQQPCSNGYDHSAHAPHASTGARAVRRRSRIPRPTLAHDGLPARCVHLPRE